MGKAVSSESMTPMMRQYYELKEQAQDAILFFRMGDFYEIFGDDAQEVAPRLELVLTSRERGDSQRIPFCGVPHHAAKNYWLKLIKLGYKVAIADQIEDPKETKGLVKRAITKYVTPGVVDELEGLEQDSANYIMSIYEDPKEGNFAIALADVSTGEFRIGNLKSESRLPALVERFRPREVLVRKFYRDAFSSLISSQREELRVTVEVLPEAPLRTKEIQSKLLRHCFGGTDLSKQPCGMIASGKEVTASLLAYLEQLQVNMTQFTSIRPLFEPDTMMLDEIACRDLELFESARRRQLAGSLFKEINCTRSAMGARLLKASLAQPFIKHQHINAIQEAVQSLHDQVALLTGIRDTMNHLPDLDRLATRVLGKAAHPTELAYLRHALNVAKELLGNHLDKLPQQDVISEIKAQLVGVDAPLALLEAALCEAPAALGAGDQVFRPGYSQKLDELNALAQSGTSRVSEYEARLREETGINSLKIKPHKTFGLLIEVTKSNLKRVPKHFVRRQTMVNNERFVTDELIALDETLSNAKDQVIHEESSLYFQLLEKFACHKASLRLAAAGLAQLDVLQSYAWKAKQDNFVRPELSADGDIEILASRHPVVETFVGKHHFTANDIKISADQPHLLITGPNMAGKSTIMRQLALSAILHQMGCFIPARSARLPLFDRVFTRVGASDDLSRGQSTFFVEMSEAAQILRHASRRSLVILDEVGRGTSTQDGLAIASAILEDLATRLKCHSLFATHYHELVPLADSLPGVQTVQTEVVEENGKIRFTHRLIPGASGSSFGIEVAKIAGIPQSIIDRAAIILRQLEQNERQQPDPAGGALFAPEARPADLPENHLRTVSDRLKKLVIQRTTPLQALNILHDLKASLEGMEQPGLFD